MGLGRKGEWNASDYSRAKSLAESLAVEVRNSRPSTDLSRYCVILV